jgi:hypothetical protein
MYTGICPSVEIWVSKPCLKHGMCGNPLPRKLHSLKMLKWMLFICCYPNTHILEQKMYTGICPSVEIWVSKPRLKHGMCGHPLPRKLHYLKMLKWMLFICCYTNTHILEQKMYTGICPSVEIWVSKPCLKLKNSCQVRYSSL